MINTLLQRIVNRKAFYCPVCDTATHHFDPLPEYYFGLARQHECIYSLNEWETLNYKNYSCPNCKCSDRERLYALYLKKYFSDSSGSETLTFIDFAPGPPLSNFIRKTYKNLNYRTADLMADNVDDKVDICDMKIYEDNAADFFLCSHVLEHVTDDKKAMRELYRILKPGGKGIAMVPIPLTLADKQEDPNITTEEDRWKYYGQGDHLRMYSKNAFVKGLTEVGFKVQELGVNEFGASIFEKAAITTQSVLYIVAK